MIQFVRSWCQSIQKNLLSFEWESSESCPTESGKTCAKEALTQSKLSSAPTGNELSSTTMSMSGSVPRLEASDGTWTPWGIIPPPDVDATLYRFHMTSDVTMGRLVFHGLAHRAIYTLELPWKDNRQEVSCIPAGVYECAPYSSEKYPDVYEVLNVPGRTAILIHVGNWTRNTLGCILPGFSPFITDGENAVRDSSLAMALIRKIVGQKRFTLRVVEL